MRTFFIKKGTNNNSYQLISDDLDFVADKQDIQEKCPEGLTEVVLKSDHDSVLSEKDAEIEKLRTAIIEASDYSKRWAASGLDMFANGTFRQLANELQKLKEKV